MEYTLTDEDICRVAEMIHERAHMLTRKYVSVESLEKLIKHESQSVQGLSDILDRVEDARTEQRISEIKEV